MPPIERKPFTPQSRPAASTGARPAPRPAWGSWPARPFQSGTWARPFQSTGTRPASTGTRPPQSGGRPWQWGPRDARMVYINEMIKAPKVLLIDENGEKMGVISRDEALRRASTQWLDLVQLAYNAVDMICTAKIVDYGRYMYDKQKDDKEKKKTQKSKWWKEIKMSYTIWDNDLLLKMKKAEEFLWDGYTVRFSVRLKWREKMFASKVVEKLHNIETQLDPFWKSQGVKEEPSGISLFLLPKVR